MKRKDEENAGQSWLLVSRPVLDGALSDPTDMPPTDCIGIFDSHHIFPWREALNSLDTAYGTTLGEYSYWYNSPCPVALGHASVCFVFCMCCCHLSLTCALKSSNQPYDDNDDPSSLVLLFLHFCCCQVRLQFWLWHRSQRHGSSSLRRRGRNAVHERVFRRLPGRVSERSILPLNIFLEENPFSLHFFPLEC